MQLPKSKKRKKCLKYYHRIIQFLDYESDFTNFQFKNIRGFKDRNGKFKSAVGICYKEDKFIVLDPRKDLLPTFIHEILHYIYPNWTEQKVIRMESLLINNLNLKELYQLHNRLNTLLHIHISLS